MSAVAITRESKAAITGLGVVRRFGSVVAVSGWTLAICQRGCDCHRHPQTRAISLRQSVAGQISLAKYRVCDCCQPWTWQELQGFLTDLARIETLPSTPEEQHS